MIHLRFLVLDAYPREGRAALQGAGGTLAGQLYVRMLQSLAPGCVTDVLYPADLDCGLPSGVALTDYDGVVWTGSSLTIHHDEDPRVRRQVEFARAVFAAGVPSFGSCWAVQLSVVASGGRCAANPKGREFGIARQIRLTPAAAAHPLFAGKPPVFDAFTSHADHVVDLGPEAVLLASNAFSPVQAVGVHHDRAPFWAVQYHPEYDLHEVASLCILRTDELVRQGTFTDKAAAQTYIDQLETLHADPTRSDIIAALHIDPSLLDPAQRRIEVANWIELVAARRHGASKA